MKVFTSTTRLLVFGCLLMMVGRPAQSAVIYTETVNGDFNGVRSAPTAIAIAAGNNDVFGATGKSDNVTDLDYFTFTVPTGYWLTALTVLESTLTAGNATFFGIQSGPQVTVDPNAPTAGPLLGYFLVNPASVGTNILPAMGVAAGAIGFTPPLVAGQYSAWLQDSSTAPSTYGLRFDVQPVPEPGTALLMLSGLASLRGVLRRRARK